MIKKTIKYDDFDNKPHEDDYYFHLTEMELATLQVEYKPSLTENLESLIDPIDGAAIIAFLKMIIVRSYGEKTEDGSGFVQTETVQNKFRASPAYSALFMSLLDDSDSFLNFLLGIMPVASAEKAKLRLDAAQRVKKQKAIEATLLNSLQNMDGIKGVKK